MCAYWPHSPCTVTDQERWPNERGVMFSDCAPGLWSVFTFPSQRGGHTASLKSRECNLLVLCFFLFFFSHTGSKFAGGGRRRKYEALDRVCISISEPAHLSAQQPQTNAEYNQPGCNNRGRGRGQTASHSVMYGYQSNWLPIQCSSGPSGLKNWLWNNVPALMAFLRVRPEDMFLSTTVIISHFCVKFLLKSIYVQ